MAIHKLARIYNDRLFPAPRIADSADIGEGADIAHSARIDDGAIVEPGAHIEFNAHICAGARIGRRATVRHIAIIGARADIGEGADVGAAAIVCDGVTIPRNVCVPGGAPMGCVVRVTETPPHAVLSSRFTVGVFDRIAAGNKWRPAPEASIGAASHSAEGWMHRWDHLTSHLTDDEKARLAAFLVGNELMTAHWPLDERAVFIKFMSDKAQQG